MYTFLPLFPLQLVVFPEENLNLHIFEPRYKQLIKECDEEGISFGIPAVIDGKVKEIGTEIKLLSIEKIYPNGEMDVKTKGIGLIKIVEQYNPAPEKLYIGADVEKLKHTTTGDVTINSRIIELVAELFELLKIRKDPPTDPYILLTYDIAHYVGFSLKQEYEFLTIPEETERQLFMRDHLENMLPMLRDMEMVKQRAQMNGHFKNIIPPAI
ncbi:MAG: LON peptidase substrate-binding domain-containing protein [Bacteroidota bacterium]